MKEIMTQDGLIVLANDEYKVALRRGLSVLHNRELKNRDRKLTRIRRRCGMDGPLPSEPTEA